MYCPHCGHENINDARHCSRCGKEIAEAIKAASSSSQAQSYAAPTIGVLSMEYAGFWKRFVAYVIDGILLSAVSWSIQFSLSDMVSVSFMPGMVISWLYFALMESSNKQATLGKMALGIIVTSEEGKRISFGRATGRYFAKIISGVILFIGFIMAAFTAKKQGLHDMLADTLVVRAK